MNFSEQPPSKEWAVLKYREEKIAEVWFKPKGKPLALTFRIPQKTFHSPDIGPLLTTENLLKAVGIANEEVESWRHDGVAPSDGDGANPELGRPLPPPPHDVAHLVIYVQLKPPVQVVARDECGEPEILGGKFQELAGRWNAILVLEASIDTTRISMESLRAELETESKKMLTAEEKVHALSADVAQWNQAKTRVIYALPKVRDFIHRSTWAAGAPERKKLEELFKLAFNLILLLLS